MDDSIEIKKRTRPVLYKRRNFDTGVGAVIIGTNKRMESNAAYL